MKELIRQYAGTAIAVVTALGIFTPYYGVGIRCMA